MKAQRQKFVLILVTLALVIVPLRGALAMPVMPAADSSSHCDQMQAAIASQTRMVDMQLSQADDPERVCDHDCAGDCCDGACNTCTLSSIAISSLVTASADIHIDPPKFTVSSGVAGQLVHPPFRPPISP